MRRIISSSTLYFHTGDEEEFVGHRRSSSPFTKFIARTALPMYKAFIVNISLGNKKNQNSSSPNPFLYIFAIGYCSFNITNQIPAVSPAPPPASPPPRPPPLLALSPDPSFS